MHAKSPHRPLALLLAATLASCGGDTPATPATGEAAAYRVTFEATWSASTHPADFPPGPHFSPLIGATHNSGVTFWSAGSLATPGIENMAETGGTSPLSAEIQTAITAGTAAGLLSGGGIGTSPGTISLDFAIGRTHPLVTVVSMIAPSPDWFVGVHDLSLMQGGTWRDEVVVELFAYDAGTDSGATYTAANQPTEPAVPIQRIESSPFDGPTPLGRFVFTLTSG